MAQLYCWSCGKPVSGDARGLGPLCRTCDAAGPQRVDENLRWMVRTHDGRSRGPLSRDAVREQLVRGALIGADRIARDGGDWSTIDTHVDFRAHYLPGTEAYQLIHQEQTSARRERTSGEIKRRGKGLVAAGAAVGSVALAVGASMGGWFVLPEEATVWMAEATESVRDAVGGRIETAVDEDAAKRSVRAARVLPGQVVVDAAVAAHPDVEGPAALHMARGRIALWEGTVGSAQSAREHFERALALSPDDPEAASGLAQAMAGLYGDDPGLGTLMSKAAERADAAAPDSVAGLQARAAVAKASGSGALALDLSMRCGDPPSLAGMAGEGVDLRCALTAAELGPNGGALAALHRRFGDVYPIGAARTETALRTDDLSLAIALGGRLAKEQPKEVVPQAVLARAFAGAGRFDEALQAATVAGGIDPRRLEVRRLRADLLLKHSGRAREALAEYDGIIAHDAFRRMADQSQLFADAAGAALAAGASDRAIELADLSLKADRGNPAATLHKARAQVQRGDKTGAETTLRDTDLSRISGHQQARYHVGAARVYLALGRERMAVDELANARDSDAHWPIAALETARARLRVKNLIGAIELIESVAYMDGLQAASRSPLHAVWYPDTDWGRMRRDLERGLVGDVRFAARGAGVLGVVSWIGGIPGARRELEGAVKNSNEVPAAHAALSQLMMLRGDLDAARFHASAVLAAQQDRAVIRAIKGRAMAASGDVAGGDAEMNKALQDDASNPGVRRHLALMLQQRGDVSGAIEAWRDVQRLAPGDVGARAALLALEKTSR